MQKKIITAVLGLALIAGAMVTNINTAEAHNTWLGSWWERLWEGEAVFCAHVENQRCVLDGTSWKNYDRQNN